MTRISTFLLGGIVTGLAVVLISCDSVGSGGDDEEKPKPPQEVEVTARTETTAGSLIEDGEIMYVLDGDTTEFSGGTASESYDKQDTNLEIIGDAFGRTRERLTVSLQSDQDTTVVLEENPADKSMVRFRFTEADTLVSPDLYIADTLAAENASNPTVAVTPTDEPVSARVEDELFETKEFQFTPDKEEVSVTLTPSP